MSEPNFKQANHTFVVSDIHLADAEPPHPENPLWKRYKLKEHFIDDEFQLFLKTMSARATGSIELILNGDIFDFDSVMTLPPARQGFSMSWLERIRGLNSEERKSRFKMKQILMAHPVWISAIQQFVLEGHRVVFIIGNHDIELHWPSVQADLVHALQLPVECQKSVRFCEWFYISNGDTLIEHGNQYDSYCLCSNPVHPLIQKGSQVSVRIPFGDIAGKFMINGMGLMNPHAPDSYIKSSVWEYLQFYYRYVMKTQPLLLWTWFWSAFATLFYSLREGFLPALRDPLTVSSRIDDIAHRSNATASMVLSLKELHVHPAIFDPIKILRELWLDRALLLGIIVFGSFQFFTFLNVFSQVSLLWMIVPLIIFLPVFIFYAHSVQSEVQETQFQAFQLAPLSAKIGLVQRIIQGHTHEECHTWVEGVEFLNTGTWSPAYSDIECTQPYGRKCFAWLRRDPSHIHNEMVSSTIVDDKKRIAELYEWKNGQAHRIPAEEPRVGWESSQGRRSKKTRQVAPSRASVKRTTQEVE
ncbi:MAG: hypothetical protein ACO3A2_05575 [Bdellovibrionia bacterium]